MNTFMSKWPAIPLFPRGGQDASEVVEATPVPVEAPAPVLEPLAAPPSAIRTCPTCGDHLASTDRRRVYCSSACRAQRNGYDVKPEASPPRAQDYAEDVLAPPRLPWDH